MADAWMDNLRGGRTTARGQGAAHRRGSLPGVTAAAENRRRGESPAPTAGAARSDSLPPATSRLALGSGRYPNIRLFHALKDGRLEKLQQFLGEAAARGFDWSAARFRTLVHGHRSARGRAPELYDHKPPSRHPGGTPLHVAACSGHTNVVHWLLEQGASPLAEDGYGRTPADVAADAALSVLLEAAAATAAAPAVETRPDVETRPPANAPAVEERTAVVQRIVEMGYTQEQAEQAFERRLQKRKTAVEARERLRELGIEKVRAADIDEGARDCAVCFVTWTDGDEPVKMRPCGHHFCEECLGRWLQTHSTCPMCRAELPAELRLAELRELRELNSRSGVPRGRSSVRSIPSVPWIHPSMPWIHGSIHAEVEPRGSRLSEPIVGTQPWSLIP